MANGHGEIWANSPLEELLTYRPFLPQPSLMFTHPDGPDPSGELVEFEEFGEVLQPLQAGVSDSNLRHLPKA